MKYGMYIDLDKCVACQSCTIACKIENNCGEGIQWNRVIAMGPTGQYPDVTMNFVPIPCQHCEDAPCTKVCPVKATYKREDGIVIQDTTKCMGCKYCMVACPYGVRSFNKTAPFVEANKNSAAWDTVPAYTNSVVAIRPKNVVEKCTFCVHRIDKGNKAPACVEACPTKCRVFGDLDDATSPISKAVRKKGTYQLKPEQKTKPKVYYGADRDR